MKTDAIYLLEPYIKTLTYVEILDVIKNGNETSLILDKTIFYPMGGGQATDQGKIITQQGDSIEVYQVQIKDGEINHFVKNSTNIVKGDIVSLELNWDRRFKNMQLHSAGHIIDFAIYLLGYSPKTLIPLKGDHNKDPHIVYSGNIQNDITIDLQNKVNEIISGDYEFKWEFVDFETLKSKAIYLQPNLPFNKPLRMLELVGVGAVADGGTIVKRTSEVPIIKITEIIQKDGTFTVTYSL